MNRYAMVLEYDGSPYRGWQKQDNVVTVQGVIENVLGRLGEDATLFGAGRTDAGVHALGQVAHVDLNKDWEPFRLMEAINGLLIQDKQKIAVLECQKKDEEFHARFSAVQRHYIYKIVVRRAPLTVTKGLAWNVHKPLNVKQMNEATKVFVGQHDFSTFRSSECQAKSPTKTLDSFDVEAKTNNKKNNEIIISATAKSFLHSQVRSMVGALKVVGEGAWEVEDVRKALNAKDRTKCPALAPPEGLYLVNVKYDEFFGMKVSEDERG